MKAQTQAVSFVLVTGITLGAITSAYVWGVPLLEKTQSHEQINTAENDLIRLLNSLDSMASGGVGGSTSVELRLGDGDIQLDEDGFTVDLSTPTGSPYPEDQFILLYGDSFVGTSMGGDPAETGDLSRHNQVVLGASGEGESTNYRLETRDLYDPNRDLTQSIEFEEGVDTGGYADVEVQIENVRLEESEGTEQVVLRVDIL